MKTVKLSWLCVALLLAATAWAQGARERPGARYMRLFDPATVIRVDGEVTKVQRVEHKMMGMTVVEATVKTADTVYTVHLGPAWFIENQELTLTTGDRITLTGSKVTVRGVLTLIASEIERGDDSLKLRDADGTPVWVAWRRKGTAGT